MAVEMYVGEGTPFYDPYYRPGTPKSEESVNRWYDDFCVFNHLHLPKSHSLSLNAAKLSSEQVHPPRQGGVLVRCGASEVIMSKPQVTTTTTPTVATTGAKEDPSLTVPAQ